MDLRAGIQSPDTTAVGPMGLVVPPERRRVGLSPINQRRLPPFTDTRAARRSPGGVRPGQTWAPSSPRPPRLGSRAW